MIRFGAVLALLLLLTACGTEPPPTTATKTTTTTAAKKKTLADLAKEPCAALTDADKTDLGVVATTIGGDPDACSWTAINGGFVLFKPFPESDETAGLVGSPAASTYEISGHTAVQLLQNNTCIVFVAVGVNQSFRVSATSDDPSISCPGSTKFATAIAANL